MHVSNPDQHSFLKYKLFYRMLDYFNHGFFIFLLLLLVILIVNEYRVYQRLIINKINFHVRGDKHMCVDGSKCVYSVCQHVFGSHGLFNIYYSS